jgi:hypothetical protein
MQENNKQTIAIRRFESYQKRFADAKFMSFISILGSFSALHATKLRTSGMIRFGVAWNEAVKGILRPSPPRYPETSLRYSVHVQLLPTLRIDERRES